jgi:hypothetical protein
MYWLRVVNRICLPALLAGALVSASGCAINRATASLTPGTDLEQIKSFYVVQSKSDSRGISTLIQQNLTKRGYTVTTGPAGAPYKADAAVTYVDKWVWDITMYLLELTITFRNPTNEFPLAVGNSLHTSLTRKSPPDMVDEVLANIFNSPKKVTAREQ